MKHKSVKSKEMDAQSFLEFIKSPAFDCYYNSLRPWERETLLSYLSLKGAAIPEAKSGFRIDQNYPFAK